MNVMAVKIQGSIWNPYPRNLTRRFGGRTEEGQLLQVVGVIL